MTDDATGPTEIRVSGRYLTAEERREVLRRVGIEHGLRVFIETGTNDGGTPWFLKDWFDELYTIELGRRAWQQAEQKFRPHRHVHCLYGDSAVVLPQVLAKVTRPALLWLDGHYSGGSTARGHKDTPIMEELDAALSTEIRHVVLVDDARLFGGMPEYGEWPSWPHINEIRDLAARHGYTTEVVDDIIHILPG